MLRYPNIDLMNSSLRCNFENVRTKQIVLQQMYFRGFLDDRSMCNMSKFAENDTDYDFIGWEARILCRKKWRPFWKKWQPRHNYNNRNSNR